MKELSLLLFILFLTIENNIAQHYSDWTGFEFVAINKDGERMESASGRFAFNELCSDYTIDLPSYFTDPEKLPEDEQSETEVFRQWARNLPTCSTDFITLEPNGVLTIQKGYRWDGASNGMPDQHYNHRSAFVHDAIYDLMRLNHLSPDNLTQEGFNNRKMTDLMYFMIAMEDGQSREMAEFDYSMIRSFGWIGTHLESKLKNWKFHVSNLNAIYQKGMVRLSWNRPDFTGDAPDFEKHFETFTGYTLLRNGEEYADIDISFSELISKEIFTYNDTYVKQGETYSYQLIPKNENTNIYDRSNTEYITIESDWGNSLNLDGEKTYAESLTAINDLCQNPGETETKTAFTFEVRFNASHKPGKNAILSLANYNQQERISIYYNGDDNRIYYFDEQHDYLASKDKFSLEEWHYLVLEVQKEGEAILYVNGASQIHFQTIIWPEHGDRFTLGQACKNSRPGNFFKGRIDEVRLWKTGDISDINIQFQDHPITADTKNLIAHWHFDEPLDFKVPVYHSNRTSNFRKMGFDASSYGNDIQIFDHISDQPVSITGLPVAKKPESAVHINKVYPNPAHSFTQIELALQDPAQVTVKIIDASGREVKTWENSYFSAGIHSVLWDVSKINPGTYICIVSTSREMNYATIIVTH